MVSWRKLDAQIRKAKAMGTSYLVVASRTRSGIVYRAKHKTHTLRQSDTVVWSTAKGWAK